MRRSLQPLLLSLWLSLRNRWEREGRHAIAISATAVLIVVALGWVAAHVLRGPVRSLLSGLTTYGFILGALVAGHALLVVSRARRRLSQAYQDSWLTPAPIPGEAVGGVIAWRVTAIAMLHLLALVAILWGLHAIADVATGRSSVILIAVAGFVVGAATGWLLPRGNRARREASRYTPRSSPTMDVQAGARALAHWPVAQVFAWHRPENSRLAIVAVLFTVQGGSSIAVGLTVVCTWLLAIYLVSLLQAVIVSGRAAADWLRATPIPLAAFAWSLGKRALLHQVIGVSIAGGLGVVLGAPPMLILYLTSLWMAIVVCICAVLLADSYRGVHAPLRLALSVAAFAAIEARAHGWAIPFAFAMTAWHVKRASRRKQTGQ
jgi:hypothetical protein